MFREKPGPGCSEKTTALVSEVWAEARVETSQLLRVQEKSWSLTLCKALAVAGEIRGQRGYRAGPRSPSGKRWREIQGLMLFSVGGRKMPGWAEGRTRRPYRREGLENTCSYSKWAEDLVNILHHRTKA